MGEGEDHLSECALICPVRQAEAEFHWLFCQREIALWATFPGSLLG